ncbi:MAG: hypothetical protein WBO84_12715 [Acidimicrobiia bacterium]
MAIAAAANHTSVLLESESPLAVPPRPRGTRVGVVVVGGMVVVVEVEVVVVAGRVVVVITGRVVVVGGTVVVVVAVEVLVVVGARVVVVVCRVVVVVGRVVVVTGGAVVVVVGGAVVVVVAGATTLTVKDPPPEPLASKIDTEYEPGAALAATRTLTWHGDAGQEELTTVSGDDADALIPPTSLVAVVETVRCSPASTVADPGLTPVIAAFAV